MGVAISRSLLDRLFAEAAASPDSEVCGLLFGHADAVEDARNAPNISAAPWNSFELDPQTLFEAIRAERAGGPRLIGFYHSHPQGGAEPSARDAADAAPDGRLWLIIGLGQARLWRAVEAGERHGRFDSVGLDMLTP